MLIDVKNYSIKKKELLVLDYIRNEHYAESFKIVEN